MRCVHFSSPSEHRVEADVKGRSTPRRVIDIVASVATAESQFSGREAQMATLSGQLDRACSGIGSVVLVEGNAGIGKSRLLEETATEARRRHFQVGSCAADPGDSMV